MLFWENFNNSKIKNKKKGKAYRKIDIKLLSLNHRIPKRAVLSASMTLEATLVLPLFIFFAVIFIYAMNLMNFQNRMNEAMYDTVRSLSKLEYSVEGSANLATATAGLYTQINVESATKLRIIGGVAGILPYKSSFDEDVIIYGVAYQTHAPFDLLRIMPLRCRQRAVVRKWIGNDDLGKNGEGASGDKEDFLVYITDYGTVYHQNRNCTYLDLSIQTVSKSQVGKYRNDEGAKYYACEYCGKKVGDAVYITNYGNRYHSNINCSGLKRGIMAVPISEIPGWKPCSRCGK